MTYRKFFTKEQELQEILARLEELYSIKLERFKELPTNSTEEGETPAWTERRAIDRLSKLVENFRFSINSGESEMEENEQLAAIDKLMQEISREAGHGYGSKDRVAQLKSYFERLVSQKRDAYRVFAKLVDDQRVRMLAIKMLAASVEHSATHREKNTKLGMMVQNIDALIHDLTGIDKDHPHYYEYGFRHHDIGSWDYAKAITELHHENSRVKRMEAEIEELKKKLAEYEPPAENGKDEAVEEDQVQF